MQVLFGTIVTFPLSHVYTIVITRNTEFTIVLSLINFANLLLPTLYIAIASSLLRVQNYSLLLLALTSGVLRLLSESSFFHRE